MSLEHVHTQDLCEAIATVGHIYCEHKLSLDRTARGIDTTLDINGSRRQPVVHLRYGAPVHVDAGDFPDLYLIMRCVDGAGQVRQRGRHTTWRPGTTVPVSANLGTEFSFGADFSQATIKPDKQKLESLCSAWLGHPLEETLRFELRAFSASLEHTWTTTLNLLDGLGSGPLPALAESSLEEFILTLLLQGHPHNYTEDLARSAQPTSSRLVRRAEAYMQECAHEPLTIAGVARELGVSIRALQLGFQACRNTTPKAFLQRIRLEGARTDLLNAAASTSVTDVALRGGFFHLGRFSAQYKTVFGESPLETLGRVKRATRVP